VHFTFANPISDWWIQLSGWRDTSKIDKGDIFCNLLENHLSAPLFQKKSPPPHPPQPISLTSRYPPVTVWRVPPHPASMDLRALYHFACAGGFCEIFHSYSTAPISFSIVEQHARGIVRGLHSAIMDTFQAMAYSNLKEHKTLKGVLECAIYMVSFTTTGCSSSFPLRRANLVPYVPHAPATGNVPG
jgi:hypothetical protein